MKIKIEVWWEEAYLAALSRLLAMTFEEFVEYCQKHAEKIFVRAEVEGQWQNVALSALSTADAWEHINRLWERIPR